MSQVFSILTLPRCRSAWLANFLDYPPVVCIHEPVRRRPNLHQLREVMEKSTMAWAGFVDPSMAALASHEWVEAFGDLPVGFVVRPPTEVSGALERAFPGSGAARAVEAGLEGLEHIHDAIGGNPPIIHARDLGDPGKLEKWLAAVMPGLPFLEGRFHQLARLRVTVAGYTAEELEV